VEKFRFREGESRMEFTELGRPDARRRISGIVTGGKPKMVQF